MIKYKSKSIKGAIFDLDGTLYCQSSLHRRMALKMVIYFALRPWRFRELIVIQNFRREVEKSAGTEVAGIGDKIRNNVATRNGLSVKRVEEITNTWMIERPLPELPKCLYPGVQELFSQLRKNGVRIGILSDFPVEQKLKALGLRVDAYRFAFEPDIDRLKPHPSGLITLLKDLGLSAGDCLYVGDRYDRDGLCALSLEMPFILKKSKKKFKKATGEIVATVSDFRELQNFLLPKTPKTY